MMGKNRTMSILGIFNIIHFSILLQYLKYPDIGVIGHFARRLAQATTPVGLLSWSWTHDAIRVSTHGDATRQTRCDVNVWWGVWRMSLHSPSLVWGGFRFVIGLPPVLSSIWDWDFPWLQNHSAMGVPPWPWKPRCVFFFLLGTSRCELLPRRCLLMPATCYPKLELVAVKFLQSYGDNV